MSWAVKCGSRTGLGRQYEVESLYDAGVASARLQAFEAVIFTLAFLLDARPSGPLDHLDSTCNAAFGGDPQPHIAESSSIDVFVEDHLLEEF